MAKKKITQPLLFELTEEEITTLQTQSLIKRLLNETSTPEITFEKNDGKRITKSSGYIPLSTQIQQLEEAGKRLEMLRQGIYDYQDENYSFDANDPTRRLNFDLAEASQLKRQAEKQIKEMNRQRYLNRIERLKNAQGASTEQNTKNTNIDTSVSMGDNKNKEISPTTKKE